jgi:hypothetical protein
MGAKEAAAEAERLKHENKGLIDAADAAALAFKNESERLAEINTQMEFYNRVVGVATTSTEQLKQGLHAAVDPIKNVFGFLEKGAAMAEKGQQQIDALQRHQADEAEARAGVKALEAKFNPQIEALRLAEKGPQFMGIDELSRRANHAAGADNKTQIDVLRQQLDQQKQELENAKRVKELTENIRDGIKQMAAKAFGWGA